MPRPPPTPEPSRCQSLHQSRRHWGRSRLWLQQQQQHPSRQRPSLYDREYRERRAGETYAPCRVHLFSTLHVHRSRIPRFGRRRRTAPAAAFNRAYRARGTPRPVSAVRKRLSCTQPMRCAQKTVHTSAMLTSLVCVERERRTSARHAAQKKSSPMPTMLMFLAPREGDRCQLLCAAVCEPHKMSSGPRGQLLLCNALDVIAGIRQRHRFSSARAAGAA